MYRLDNDFGIGHGSRVERGPAPSYFDRQAGKIDNATIAVVAAKVVSGTHKNTIDWAGLHTQRTKHALGIINRKAGDLKSLATLDPLLADVDAVHRTSLGALVARNAGGEVVAMKAPIAGRHRNRLLRIFENLGEGSAIRLIGDEPVAERDIQPVTDGVNRQPDVTKPVPHGGSKI